MLTILDPPQWQAQRARHEARVERWIAPHLARRRHGRAHPVEDFMFTYYSYRPGQLRRWHPGPSVVLAGADARSIGPEYVTTPDGATLDVDAFVRKRESFVRWVAGLLSATAGRAPHLGCFGMHEWAMVYRLPAEQVRHAAWPLRLSAADIASAVEANRVRCSHFDAYRFFTAPARPLNLLQPTRESQIDHEQPGCLHANMDLYKWAYKCAPLAGSALVADCFELAREIRTLDMRASPYDLADLGYPPVRVETAEGRAEYAVAQREFAARAATLRDRLLAALPRGLAGAGAGVS